MFPLTSFHCDHHPNIGALLYGVPALPQTSGSEHCQNVMWSSSCECGMQAMFIVYWRLVTIGTVQTIFIETIHYMSRRVLLYPWAGRSMCTASPKAWFATLAPQACVPSMHIFARKWESTPLQNTFHHGWKRLSQACLEVWSFLWLQWNRDRRHAADPSIQWAPRSETHCRRLLRIKGARFSMDQRHSSRWYASRECN